MIYTCASYQVLETGLLIIRQTYKNFPENEPDWFCEFSSCKRDIHTRQYLLASVYNTGIEIGIRADNIAFKKSSNFQGLLSIYDIRIVQE